MRDDIYLVNVVVRATADERVSLTTLRSLQIPLASGRTVPLSQLATLSFDQETPLIWRRDRVPTLTVRADVVPGVLPDGVVSNLTAGIDELNAKLPPGYQIVVGGTVEESARSQASVFAVVPIMVLLMLTFLMIQLHSFSRMVLVLAIVAAGPDRRRRGGSAARQSAARLRGDPRHPGAARHDRPQRGAS